MYRGSGPPKNAEKLLALRSLDIDLKGKLLLLRLSMIASKSLKNASLIGMSTPNFLFYIILSALFCMSANFFLTKAQTSLSSIV